MRVPDLRSSRSEPLAGGAVLALHEARVGQEVLDSGEAMDVVDLVEDRQRQDLPDAGDRAEPVVRLGIVLLGATLEMKLQLAEGRVVGLDQGSRDRGLLSRCRIQLLDRAEGRRLTR